MIICFPIVANVWRNVNKFHQWRKFFGMVLFPNLAFAPCFSTHDPCILSNLIRRPAQTSMYFAPSFWVSTTAVFVFDLSRISIGSQLGDATHETSDCRNYELGVYNLERSHNIEHFHVSWFNQCDSWICDSNETYDMNIENNWHWLPTWPLAIGWIYLTWRVLYWQIKQCRFQWSHQFYAYLPSTF